MADLKGKIVEVSSGVFAAREVSTSFNALANKLLADFKSKTPPVEIKMAQSFVSPHRVREELRQRSPKQVGLGTQFNTIDGIADLLSKPLATKEDLDKFDLFIRTGKNIAANGGQLAPSDFNPPLKLPTTTPAGLKIYPTPYYPSQDPRTTGRLVTLSPIDVVKRNDVRSWLINNSLLFGFLLYDNTSLYYVGLADIKMRLKSDPSITKLVSTFLPEPVQDNIVSITAQDINQSNFDPNPPIPTGGGGGGETGVIFTNPNNPDEECTRVTRGNTVVEIHTGREKQFPSPRVPRSIILHYTVSGGSPGRAQRTVDGVGKCGGSYITAGIHYAINTDGVIAAGIPENIRSIQGDNWNNYGIGIELISWGYVTPTDDPNSFKHYYDVRDGKGPSLSTTDVDIIQLPFRYESYSYFNEYTDIQIQALETLIRDITARNPQIAQGVGGGKNLFNVVFGIDPAVTTNPYDLPEGSEENLRSRNAPDIDPAGYGAYGIFVHNTGGGDHTDAAPTPKLVAMLERLGYTTT